MFFIGPRCTWGAIYVSQPLEVREAFADLTHVTLADQATNSIHADNANMAIQGNVAMKVTQSSGQLIKLPTLCKLIMPIWQSEAMWQ